MKAVLIAVVAFLSAPVLMGLLLIACSVSGPDPAQAACSTNGGAMTGGGITPAGKDAIPSNLIPIYRAAERRYGVPWNYLAAINRVETEFGRNLNISSAGAVGWMQFMPATWASYGVDANGDGKKDPFNPEDAIFAAANYLKASGAPGDMYKAIFAYNHADWYVEEVMGFAKQYAKGGGAFGDPVPFGGSCELADNGVPGKVIIAPGANSPGQPIKKELMDFLARTAGIYGKPITVTTGTNHSYYTANGNVSDHAIGYGADFGMSGNGWPTLNDPGGDRLAAAALVVAGDTPAEARKNALIGMIHNRTRGGLQIQVIWRCAGLACGGDHTNHVHIGAKPG